MLGFMVFAQQLGLAWCHPVPVPREGYTQQCAEARGKGCARRNVLGNSLPGISQDSAASDSNPLRQEVSFLGQRKEY